MSEDNISCLSKYIDLITRSVIGLSKRHRTFLDTEPLVAFRGESKDYAETKLTPSLFRQSSYLAKERHLFELFCDYSMVSQTASNIEKAIDAQHYVSISRMLDITFDALVALYFACVHSKGEDGYVYVFAFPEHYSPHSNYIEEFYTNVLEGKHIAYSRNFKVFSHSFVNDRVKAQKGGFIFFPGKEFHPINSCYYDRVQISKNDKDVVLGDLEILFQHTEATLFPEKDKIAEVIKRKFEHSTYTPKAVSLESEIEAFFDRINYELKMLREMGKTSDKKTIMRWLRKEEDDLTSYVLVLAEEGNSDTNEDTDRLISQVKRNFAILQIRYKEAPDGK